MVERVLEPEFEVMVRKVQPFLVAYARRRLLDPVTADDIVAETLIIAWRRWSDVPRDGQELPYLYGVASRVLANQKRSIRRQQRLVDRLEQNHSFESDVDQLTDREMLVAAALDRIRKPDQEILRLSFWENLSCREIGVVLGCSENAATVRLHRARKRLEEQVRSDLSQWAEATGTEES
jgi:RNA polymerase sigma-70 factor (ECF subfamily)